MRNFLLSRYLFWLVGSLAGLGSQLAWLKEHHWRGAGVRLSLAPLVGALALWLVAEALAWVLARRSWSFWPGLARAGAWLGRLAAVVTGLDLPRGRRAWAVALVLVALALGHWWWQADQLRRSGEAAILTLFQSHRQDGQGWRLLLFPEANGWAPDQDEGQVKVVGFDDLEQLPTHRRQDFHLVWLAIWRVEKAGWHQFQATVDDGLELWVDGHQVIHDLRESAPHELRGSIWLDEGEHAFLARYMQLAGGGMLRLCRQAPGAACLPLDPGAFTPVDPDLPLGRIEALRLEHRMIPALPSTYPPFDGGRFWRLPW